MPKNYKNIQLDPKYIPKKTEKYMSEEQKAYFYNMLMAQRAELLAEIEDDMSEMSSNINLDAMDGANDEADNSSSIQQADKHMKFLNRNKNLLVKIDATLDRLEQGTYGYSVISGDEIGLKRLMANPFSTLTIEERNEVERRR